MHVVERMKKLNRERVGEKENIHGKEDRLYGSVLGGGSSLGFIEANENAMN